MHYHNRVTFQFGLENDAKQKMRLMAKRLHIHPGWLLLQMTNMLNDNPALLFEYLSKKARDGSR